MTASHPPVLIAQIDTAQDETTGDFYYRDYAPGVAMSLCRDVFAVNLTSLHRNREEIMREADVLALINLCDPDLLPVIRERRQRGKVTVYELCDDLDDTPPGSPAYAYYRNPENSLLLKRIARACDAVQFSSPELQRKYGSLNRRTTVFPNHILEIPPRRNHSNGEGMTVGWGGSLGHLDDMKKIADPLIRWILSRTDVKLHLMCADPIRDLFKALPEGRKKHFSTGSLWDYYRFLTTIDVGLAPLKDTPFNRSRSDVKFLEYAVHGVVPVVQASGPYLRSVRDGATGLFFRTGEELIARLDGLARDTSRRLALAEAARDYVVRERSQADHGSERVDFYRSLGRPIGSPDAPERFARLAEIPGAVRSGRHALLNSTRFELLVRGGMLAADLADPEKSAGMFREAAHIEPRSHMPHLFGAYVSGNVRESLKKAIALNPRSIKARMLLGDVLSQDGEKVEAMECFSRAAEIYPNYELPYIKTAMILKELGMEREGVTLMRKAKELLSNAFETPVNS
ncbi:MAG: glycosyltransferase [Acidobacteriota bacterium]